MATEYLVQIERALQTLLEAALDHDAAQQAVSSGTIAAARLRWIDINVAPENDREDLVPLLHDPIGASLRLAIRRFGEHLFSVHGTTAAMSSMVERLLTANPALHIGIIQLVDLAWDGIGNGQDHWSA